MIFLMKGVLIPAIPLPANEKAPCFYFNNFSHEYIHVFSAGTGTGCL